MAKTWEEMTDPERIQDLRKDMKETMATVNSLAQSLRQLGADHNRVSNLLSEVANAVKELERKAGT